MYVCVCLEGSSGEAQQDSQDRVKHLEKELFFYKSSSRQLKKKLKECLSDASHPAGQPSNAQKPRQIPESPTHPEEVQKSTHIKTKYTNIHCEPADEETCRDSHMRRHASCPSSSSDLKTHKRSEVAEHKHTPSQRKTERGVHSLDRAGTAPVRLCRRDLREIPPAALQGCGSANRRRRSVVETSSESVLEDSIEAARNTSQ